MLVQVISFLAEVVCADLQVIIDRVIDPGGRIIIAAFYHVDEALVMHETLDFWGSAAVAKHILSMVEVSCALHMHCSLVEPT